MKIFNYNGKKFLAVIVSMCLLTASFPEVSLSSLCIATPSVNEITSQPREDTTKDTINESILAFKHIVVIGISIGIAFSMIGKNFSIYSKFILAILMTIGIVHLARVTRRVLINYTPLTFTNPEFHNNYNCINWTAPIILMLAYFICWDMWSYRGFSLIAAFIIISVGKLIYLIKWRIVFLSKYPTVPKIQKLLRHQSKWNKFIGAFSSILIFVKIMDYILILHFEGALHQRILVPRTLYTIYVVFWLFMMLTFMPISYDDNLKSIFSTRDEGPITVDEYFLGAFKLPNGIKVRSYLKFISSKVNRTLRSSTAPQRSL